MDLSIGVDTWSETLEGNFVVEQKTKFRQSQLLTKIFRYKESFWYVCTFLSKSSPVETDWLI